MITHLQETWKIQNKVTYSSTIIVVVLSHVQLFVTSVTVAHQALQPMEFSRQKSWSGFPFPTPGDLPYPRIKPKSLVSSAGRFFTPSTIWEALKENACMLSCFSCVQLCVTQWTAAHRAPPSTGFSRQEHWSGLPLPSPLKRITEGKFAWYLGLMETLGLPR